MRYPILIVAIISTLFSVMIEVARVPLPTRDSSMTDVLTNSLGGTIGAWLWWESWAPQNRRGYSRGR